MIDGIFDNLPRQTWEKKFPDLSYDEHLRQQEQGNVHEIETEQGTVFLVPSVTDHDRFEVTYKQLYNLKALLRCGATIHEVNPDDETITNPNLTEQNPGDSWEDF